MTGSASFEEHSAACSKYANISMSIKKVPGVYKSLLILIRTSTVKRFT